MKEDLKKQIEREFKKKKLHILPEDVILLLLYSHKDKPIINRTVLFKEVFLSYEEILKSRKMVDIANPLFFAYKFGPFSYKISETLWFLISSGLVQKGGRSKGKKEQFRITETGIKVSEMLLKKMPKNMSKDLINDLSIRRKGWDQLGRDGILNYVYKSYPDYTKKSKIKDKYGMTIWGELFKE